MSRETSDGSKAGYYDLPEGAKQLGDLIAYRNLNHADGEMFCAIYRKGRASHSDALRDVRKVLFYAAAEVDRLEKYESVPSVTYEAVPPVSDMHAQQFNEERADIIGQNGNDGEHYHPV